MTITSNASAPLVAVIGATGAQGSSVIKALAESDKEYRIRGFTRDTSKAVSQDLVKQGVEVVALTPTPEHKDAVFKAFEGASIVFAVTVFAAHFSKVKEVAEGKLFVDAAKAANVKLLIWSGLENMTEISGGKYTHVDHFDGKADVTAYAKASGVPFKNVEAAMYMENFLNAAAAPRKQPDGSFALACVAPPESLVVLVNTTHDYGLFVRKAIEEKDGQQEIYAHGEVISWADMAKQLSEVTGKKIAYVQIPNAVLVNGMVHGAGWPEVVANEFLEMFLSVAEFGYYGKKELGSSLQGLARAPRTWVEFVKATDWSKILA